MEGVHWRIVIWILQRDWQW
ncbi:unnamed protein product [Victoria cruziana]